MPAGKEARVVYEIWLKLIVTKFKKSKARYQEIPKTSLLKHVEGRIRCNSSPRVLSITFSITHQRRAKIR